jgi:tripartite-type tricarboxylate transporter receptor subunit TctC
MKTCRTACVMIASLAALLSPRPAPAQSPAGDYPAKPVRIVVPSPPGGGTDTIGRITADALSRLMGRQFIVENKAGAGNIIGTEFVARAAPDGYTLLMSASPLTINHLTTAKLPYDAVADFAPVSMVVSVPSALIVYPGMPVKSVGELIAMAKAKPGELSYGTAGIGTNPHISMELFKTMAGIDILHIPFKGISASMIDILAGRLCCMIANALSAKPHVDSGKLRALAVTSLTRLDSMPGIPTVSEAGVPGYESLQWFGLLAPAKTPEPIVTLLHAKIVEALADPTTRSRLSTDGATPVASKPAEFAAHIKSEIEKWNELAKVAKLKPE